MTKRRQRSILALGVLALSAIATGCSSSQTSGPLAGGFFGQIAAGDSLGLSLGARESTPKAVAAEPRRATQPTVASAQDQ